MKSGLCLVADHGDGRRILLALAADGSNVGQVWDRIAPHVPDGVTWYCEPSVAIPGEGAS